VSHSRQSVSQSVLNRAVGWRILKPSNLKHTRNSVSCAERTLDTSYDLPPMTWGTRTLHRSVDIQLIPGGTEFLARETPYGLVVRLPAHNESIAYLRKGDCIIDRSESLAGLTESGGRDQNMDFSHYTFQDWQKSSPASENIWKSNSKNSNISALLGAVMDTGAQRGATGSRAEILKNTGHTVPNL